ncbi:MAG: iron hydrogenase small subunit, partial [Acidaminococcaceae bacterium]
RREALFDCDQASVLRKSHENPEIIKLYANWLGEPLGPKAHHLLHTHYTPQTRK